MTREEQITYKAGSIADGCIAHGAPWKDYYQGFIEGAKWADANPPQPSLPSNLDEAAGDYAIGVEPDRFVPDEGNGYKAAYTLLDIKAAFKAGAEWMVGQGETVEGVFKAGDPGYPDVRMGEQYNIEHILRKPDGIEPGDEVLVQIRKK